MKVLNTKEIYNSNLPAEILTNVCAWFHEVSNGRWESVNDLNRHYPDCRLFDSKVFFPVASSTYLIVTCINFSSEIVLILEIRENDQR